MSKKIGRPPLMERASQDKRIKELKIILASYHIKYETKCNSLKAKHRKELAEELKAARKRISITASRRTR